jgi:23S rRNA pseudouridine2605 synthase
VEEAPQRPKRLHKSASHVWRSEDRLLRRKFHGNREEEVREKFKPDPETKKKAGLIADRKGRRILVERFGEKKPEPEPEVEVRGWGRRDGGEKAGDRKFTERSERPRGDRKFAREDRPRGGRSFEKRERPFEKRGERSFDKGGDRPYRKREDRPRGERSFGDKPRGEPGFSERPRGERSFGKPGGVRPRGGRPGGKPGGKGPRRDRTSGPRPSRPKE